MRRPLLERLVLGGLIVASFFAGWIWRGSTQMNGGAAAEAGGTDTAAGKTGEAGKPGAVAGKGAGGGAAAVSRQVMDALDRVNEVDRALSLVGILQNLSADNWKGVLEAFLAQRKLTGRQFPGEWDIFVRRAGAVGGKEAVEYFLKNHSTDTLRSALNGWASAHPVEALEWLRTDASNETRRLVQGAAIRGLALSEPDLAVSLIDGIPLGARQNYVYDFAYSLIQGAGVDQAGVLINGMIAKAAANGELDQEYLKHVFADYAEIKTRRAWVKGEITEAANWVASVADQPYVSAPLIRSTAERLTPQDPLKALSWLDGINARVKYPDTDGAVGYSTWVATWAQSQGTDTVGTWLGANTTHPQYDRMALQYSLIMADKDVAAAQKWAETISNAGLRKTAVDRIAAVAAQAKGKK